MYYGKNTDKYCPTLLFDWCCCCCCYKGPVFLLLRNGQLFFESLRLPFERHPVGCFELTLLSASSMFHLCRVCVYGSRFPRLARGGTTSLTDRHTLFHGLGTAVCYYYLILAGDPQTRQVLSLWRVIGESKRRNAERCLFPTGGRCPACRLRDRSY